MKTAPMNLFVGVSSCFGNVPDAFVSYWWNCFHRKKFNEKKLFSDSNLSLQSRIDQFFCMNSEWFQIFLPTIFIDLEHFYLCQKDTSITNNN